MTERRKQIVTGSALIVMGLVLFVAVQVDLGASIVLMLIGTAFLAAYFYRVEYGFLIPGCILVGLGAGQMAGELRFLDNPVRLGLGCGFLAIYFIGLVYERNTNWWPLIPGGVLIVLSLPNLPRVVNLLTDYWPLILVAIGAMIVLGALINPRGARRT